MRRLQGKPPCSDLFGVKGPKWLRSLQLPIEEAETVQSALRQIAFLEREIADVERLIAKQTLHSPDARRLMTVPGVNLIATATFLAAIGDITRFKFAAAGRLPRPGPEGPPVRRAARPLGTDHQARLGLRALGAGRGRLERRQPARRAARPLPAHQGPPRTRQGDRRRRAQARGAVLVPAAPRRGLRPPAAVADRVKAPPA